MDSPPVYIAAFLHRLQQHEPVKPRSAAILRLLLKQGPQRPAAIQRQLRYPANNLYQRLFMLRRWGWVRKDARGYYHATGLGRALSRRK